MNDLYTSEWNLLLNRFLPSVKLIEKHREASKTIKHYNAPLTPLQRVLNALKIPRSVKAQLRRQLESLNPFLLHQTVKQKIKLIHQVPPTTLLKTYEPLHSKPASSITRSRLSNHVFKTTISRSPLG